jgi:hypothetical protein
LLNVVWFNVVFEKLTVFTYVTNVSWSKPFDLSPIFFDVADATGRIIPIFNKAVSITREICIGENLS